MEIESANDRTHVSWKRGLGGVAARPAVAPQVHVLRKRAAVFGHNAPLWRSMNDEFRDGYTKIFGGAKDGNEWPKFAISPESPATSISMRCSLKFGPAASRFWPSLRPSGPSPIELWPTSL